MKVNVWHCDSCSQYLLIDYHVQDADCPGCQDVADDPELDTSLHLVGSARFVFWEWLGGEKDA